VARGGGVARRWQACHTRRSASPWASCSGGGPLMMVVASGYDGTGRGGGGWTPRLGDGAARGPERQEQPKHLNQPMFKRENLQILN
jgi:hypothetical protein